SVPLEHGRLHGRPPQDHARAGAGLLRDLLRAEQRNARARGGRRPGDGLCAGRPLLRQDPAPAAARPRGCRGARAGRRAAHRRAQAGRAAGGAHWLARGARGRSGPGRARRRDAGPRRGRELAPLPRPGPRARGGHAGRRRLHVGHRPRPRDGLRPGPSAQARRGPARAHRCGARRARARAGARGGAREGEAAPARAVRARPQDRERQGEQARLLPDGVRRLPRALRPRGGLGGRERRGRAPGGGDLPRSGQAHGGRARAGRWRGGTMRRAAALGFLLLLASGARAVEELRLPPVTRTVLPNGLKLVVAEYHELPLVELYVIVGAGAGEDPPGKDGLAQLVASSLKRGAGGLSAEALARAIESLGGTVTVAAGSDGTTLTAEFLSGDFATGLDLVRRVLREPAFDKDEVRRARDEQIAGITASFEDPSAVADKCFAAFLYGTYAYGRPVEGRRATVAHLDRGDVRAFYDRWYRPNDTIVALVGDVTAAEAVERLGEAFGTWRARPDALAGRAAAPTPTGCRRRWPTPSWAAASPRSWWRSCASSGASRTPPGAPSSPGSRGATSAWGPSRRARRPPRPSRLPSTCSVRFARTPRRRRRSRRRRPTCAGSSRSGSRPPTRSRRGSRRSPSRGFRPTTSRPSAGAWPR